MKWGRSLEQFIELGLVLWLIDLFLWPLVSRQKKPVLSLISAQWFPHSTDYR